MTPYIEGKGRKVTLGPVGIAALGEPGRDFSWEETDWWEWE